MPGALRCRRAIIERAIELDDGNSEAAFNLGVLYRRAGRLEEALQAFALALETNGEFTSAATAHALLLERLGRGEEARRSWTELAERLPTAYLQLARFEVSQQRPTAARAALDRARSVLGGRYAELVAKVPELRQFEGP